MKYKAVIAIIGILAVISAAAATWLFVVPREQLFGDYRLRPDPDIFLDPTHCGNGTLEGYEQCDPTACVWGSDGVWCGSDQVCGPGQLCSPSSCACAPALDVTCGNGFVDLGWGEECDPTACSEGTWGVFCGIGDGCDPGDLCDPNSCACAPALEVTCGNGVVEPLYGELCDPAGCTTGTDGVFCGSTLVCGATSTCSPTTCQCVGGSGEPLNDQQPGDGGPPPDSGPPVNDQGPGPGNRVQEFIPVYDCVYLGNNLYEWYEAMGTYLILADGTKGFESAEVTGGPFRGEWQPGCIGPDDQEEPPSGDGDGDSGPPVRDTGPTCGDKTCDTSVEDCRTCSIDCGSC